MESVKIEKALLFEGFSDLTLHEIQIWKSVMFDIIGANKLYVDKMTSAADALAAFDKLSQRKDKVSNNSKSAADRVAGLLVNMANFHHDVYGDFSKFTSATGPFGDIMGVSDKKFEELKSKMKVQKKEHEQLEKTAEKAWKRYQKKEKRRLKKEKILAKKMCPEGMLHHKQYTSFKGKAESALLYYDHCHSQEVNNREKLLSQSIALRKEFLKEEKDKLDKMFEFINNSLGRMQKLVPQGLADVQDLDFSPEVANTRVMAKKAWEGHLVEHKFPVEKDRSQIARSDGEDGDKESDDSDSDSDDDISMLNHHVKFNTSTPVKPFRAADSSRQNDSGIFDALREINEDIDNQPSFLKFRDSPEPRKSLFTPNPDWEPAKDRPMTPESQDDSTSKSVPRKSKPEKTTDAGSSTGVKSEARRRRRAVKQAKEDVNTTKALLPPTDEKQVVHKSNIAVYVIKEHIKQTTKELTIRKGMRIKQTRGVDNNGMAYGYKKTKMGLKKYGLYPSMCVSLEAPKEETLSSVSSLIPYLDMGI